MPHRPLSMLSHVELLTHKLEESVAFARDILGLDVVGEEGDSVYLRCWGDYYAYSLVHVPGDIELHVRGTGRDRIVHEAAQDADQALRRIVGRFVAGEARSDRRVGDQEGRRRERHLHDPVRQSVHEGGLTGGRAVDLGDPARDGDRSLVLDDAAVVAAELQRALTRGQAVDCIEERVEVHEATELPIGHDLEPDRFLPRHHPTDGIVLEVA